MVHILFTVALLVICIFSAIWSIKDGKPWKYMVVSLCALTILTYCYESTLYSDHIKSHLAKGSDMRIYTKVINDKQVSDTTYIER